MGDLLYLWMVTAAVRTVSHSPITAWAICCTWEKDCSSCKNSFTQSYHCMGDLLYLWKTAAAVRTVSHSPITAWAICSTWEWLQQLWEWSYCRTLIVQNWHGLKKESKSNTPVILSTCPPPPPQPYTQKLEQVLTISWSQRKHVDDYREIS